MPFTHVSDEELVGNELLEDRESLEEDAISEEELRLNKILALEVLGQELEAKFTKYHNKRTDKEQEWAKALLQYNGSDDYGKEKGKMHESPSRRRIPKPNITRSPTNLAVSRMRDIQFPLGGDYNFHIEALIDPELEELIDQQQQTSEQEQQQAPVPPAPPAPLPPDQAIQLQAPPQEQNPVASVDSEINEEREKALRMQTLIRNQLAASRYGKKARQAMRDWAILGTGILKGPEEEVKKSKMYDHYLDSDGGLQSELVVDHITMPEVYFVDPRLFYPDPGALLPEDIEDCFEVHPVGKRELIRLSDNPHYLSTNIKAAVLMKPDGNRLQSTSGLFTSRNGDADFSNKYLVKEYHGSLPKDVLHLMGYISNADKEDPLKEFFGKVFVVRGVVIRVSMALLDGDDTIPYHMAVWEQDDSSVFGHGMPYMRADQQRVVESTYAMLLDNAGLSAGPQIVLNRDAIQPANNKWEIESMKIWYMTEYGTNVQDAFQFVNIPNNQQSLMNIIDSAMQFADIESQSPMIQAHTTPQANVPAMNMGMVLTEANVHQRELSQHWDDNITIPLINRWVHYNMQYSADPGIKGNFKVAVGGATERIDNQILAQDIERILAMASQNPDYMVQINEAEAFRRWVAATRAGPSLLRSTHEVNKKLQERQQAAANIPPDPQMIQAEAVMMREQSRQEETQAKLQIEQQSSEVKLQLAQADLQLRKMELQLRAAELQAKQTEKQMELQIALLTAQNNDDMNLRKMDFDLNIEQSKQDLTRELKAIDLEKFNTELSVKLSEGSGI